MNIIPDAARHPGITDARFRELRRNYMYDGGNAFAGRKIGKSYGTMYRVVGDFGLVPVQYDEKGREIECLKLSPTQYVLPNRC